jgi:V8-like Glu-specific endopeptidase
MIDENTRSKIQKLYAQFSGAVAYITVTDIEENEGIGTAFHIGEGIFLTAKHVIEGKTIKEVATTKLIELLEEKIQGKPKKTLITPSILQIIEGPYSHENEDIAVFKVDINNLFIPNIQIGSHTNHEVTDNDFILSNVVVIGYPPIPFTTTPNQVVATGQVNATIDVWHSNYVHFVLSTMARGGFSGGVVLTESGAALGLVTESLGKSDSLVETGYMSILSIEAGAKLAETHFQFNLQENNVYRDEDCLIEVKMVSDDLSRLNSRLFNACIYVLDDGRDVYIEIFCDDEKLLQPAFDIFNVRTPISRGVPASRNNVIFGLPLENPPAELLAEAAEAVKAFFAESGYKELSTKRNAWQFCKSI